MQDGTHSFHLRTMSWSDICLFKFTQDAHHAFKICNGASFGRLCRDNFSTDTRYSQYSKHSVFYIISLGKVFPGSHFINCKHGLPNGNHPAPGPPTGYRLSLRLCFCSIYFRFNLHHIQGFHLFDEFF